MSKTETTSTTGLTPTSISLKSLESSDSHSQLQDERLKTHNTSLSRVVTPLLQNQIKHNESVTTGILKMFERRGKRVEKAVRDNQGANGYTPKGDLFERRDWYPVELGVWCAMD